MVKQYGLIKKLFILVSILTILQIILLCIEPDTNRIVFSIIVGICFVVILIIFIVAKIEYNKIWFEYIDGDIEVRLIGYDDYQNLRVLYDQTPLENTQEEVNKLHEYELLAVDFSRIRFHYIVLENNNPIGVFYSNMVNNEAEIEIKKAIDDVVITNIVNKIAKQKNKIIKIK